MCTEDADGLVLPGKKAMDRHRLGRPSLKITRQRNPNEGNTFVVEVWNPFIGTYQLAETVKLAMQRVEELASLICQMRIQRHAKRNMLTDPPDVDGTDDLQWAEFRINASTYRSYDTRCFDRRSWSREAGLTYAVNKTCARISYATPIS